MNFKESFKINPKKLRDLIIAELLFYILIISFPALLTQVFSFIFDNLGEQIQALNSTENLQQLLMAQTQLQSMFWGLILFIILLITGLLVLSGFTSYLAYMTQFDKKLCCEKRYWRFLLSHFVWIVFFVFVMAFFVWISYVWTSIWTSIFLLVVFVFLAYVRIYFMSSTIMSTKIKTSFKNLRYMFTKNACRRTLIAFLIFMIFGMLMNLTSLVNTIWLNQLIFYFMLSVYIIWARNYLGETFREEMKETLEKKKKPKEEIKKKTIKKKTIKKTPTKKKAVKKKSIAKKKVTKKRK